MLTTVCQAEIYQKSDGYYYWKYSSEQPTYPLDQMHHTNRNSWDQITGNIKYANPSEEYIVTGNIHWRQIGAGSEISSPAVEEKHQGVKGAKITLQLYHNHSPYKSTYIYTDDNGNYSAKFKLPNSQPSGVKEPTAWSLQTGPIEYNGKKYTYHWNVKSLRGHFAGDTFEQIYIKNFGILNEGEKIAKSGEHKENMRDYIRHEYIHDNPENTLPIRGKVYTEGKYKNIPLKKIFVRLDVDGNTIKKIAVDEKGNFDTTLKLPDRRGMYSLLLTPTYGNEVGLQKIKRFFINFKDSESYINESKSDKYSVVERSNYYLDLNNRMKKMPNSMESKEFKRIFRRLRVKMRARSPEKIRAYARSLVPNKDNAVKRVTEIIELLNKYKNKFMVTRKAGNMLRELEYLDYERHIIADTFIRTRKLHTNLIEFYLELIKIADSSTTDKIDLPKIDINGVWLNKNGTPITLLDFFNYIKNNSKTYYNGLFENRIYEINNFINILSNAKNDFVPLKNAKDIKGTSLEKRVAVSNADKLYNELNKNRFLGNKSISINELSSLFSMHNKSINSLTKKLPKICMELYNKYGWVVTWKKQSSLKNKLSIRFDFNID